MQVSNPVLLDHERLDAFRVAVELDLVVVRALEGVRRHRTARVQADDASVSVVLNLAESVGREGGDRAYHLRVARGSLLELDAALTLLTHRRACPPDARAEARALAVRLAAMLHGLLARASR